MHYLIDGYNLLFRKLESGQSIQNQRQNLIHTLQKISNTLHLSTTVVFDSAYQEYEGTRSHIQTLEVVFTDKGQTADDYIVGEVRRNPHPQQLIVVSSDNKLAWRCRQLGAKTESVEEFAKWTRERLKKRERQEEEKRDTTWDKIEVKLEEKEEKAEREESSPTPKSTAEASFDYYLKVFEEEDVKSKKTEKKKEKESPKPPPQKEEKPKTKPLKKQEKPSTPESEMDRWLDIFEERSEEDK